MNKKIFFVFGGLFLLFFSNFVLATPYTITIRGEPRTPDGKIDLMYDAGIYGAQGKIEADVKIDNDNGFFEIRNYTFDDTIIVNSWPMENSVSMSATGGCFVHNFYIVRRNNQFEVFDHDKPQGSEPIRVTKENYIDLGILNEDKSNQVMVNSDEGVTFAGYNSEGRDISVNTGYTKINGGFNTFSPHSRYKIVMQSEKGKKWEQEIVTGDYCESTRIIKRGDYLLVENFPNNTFPPIGFWRGAKLWFRGLFS